MNPPHFFLRAWSGMVEAFLIGRKWQWAVLELIQLSLLHSPLIFI